MRVSVDALLVIRRGGELLEDVFRALAAQSRPLDRVCVVDASADSSIAVVIDEGLSGLSASKLRVSVPYGTSFADAVADGLTELYPSGDASESAWLWLLRDDTIAHEDALSALAVSVEGAPMVKIAGPKQRMADQPLIIREMGETMTRFGERIGLAERELDQAQFDRMSDVLAVGETGMFAHSQTLLQLGGFDPGLSPLDGGLDLGVRARLAGHRVIVVPRAVISVGAGPADWHEGKKISPLRHRFLARRAWLYRRFVYAPAWALIPLILWVLPWSFVRALGQVVLKHPDRIFVEVTSALSAVAKLPSVMTARSTLQASRTTTWATIDSLRLPPQEVRKRRIISRESLRAEEEENADLQPTPPLFPALPWLLLTLTVLGGIVFGRWWGSGVLLGGGILPMPSSLNELWVSVWLTHPIELGLDAPPVPSDPGILIFALLGSITWWWPSLSLVGLFIAALPLAGLSAWWGASQVLSKAWTTALVGLLWAVSPTFLISLAEGRVGAVIAHIALPWLVGSALTAHDSWQRAGQLSLAVLIVTAVAPVLWPSVVLGLVIVLLARSWSKPFRMLAGVLPLALAPSILLGLPRFFAWWDMVEGRWWTKWGILFADPGVGVASDESPWWAMVAGWPSSEALATVTALTGVNGFSASLVAFVVAVPVVVTAALSLALGKGLPGATLATLVGLGLLSATAAPALESGFEGLQQVSVWPGTAVSILVFGVIVAAGATLDRVEFEDSLGNRLGGGAQWVTRLAAGALVASSVLPLASFSVSSWQGQTLVQPSAVLRTVPAFVAAEAQNQPEIGTLVIEETAEGFDVSVERGSGQLLTDTSTLVRGRSVDVTARDEELALLVASLVRPSSSDPTELLQKYGIRFIWLKAGPDSEAALNLARRPELISASSAEAGQLWQTTVDPASIASVRSEPPTQGLFWLVLGVAGLLALPTERRARAGNKRIDDALPSLGEETSDND